MEVFVNQSLEVRNVGLGGGFSTSFPSAPPFTFMLMLSIPLLTPGVSLGQGTELGSASELFSRLVPNSHGVQHSVGLVQSSVFCFSPVVKSMP